MTWWASRALLERSEAKAADAGRALTEANLRHQMDAAQLLDRNRSLEREVMLSQGAFAALQVVLDGALKHNRELTQTLVDLKREGFQPAAAPDVLAPVETGVPDAVELAIRQRAGKGTSLEQELRRWGAEMIRGGAEPEAVATMVLQGGGDEDGS